MPLTNILYPNSSCRIAFWHISESIEQLKELWGKDLAIDNLPENASIQRQKETITVRLLLRKMLKTQAPPLHYDQFRRPFLKNHSSHLSISHSLDKVAVMIHDHQEAGIDVEHIKERVMRIRSKFMNEKELLFSKDSIIHSTLIWSAKESLYKYYGRKSLEFKEHLLIPPFELQTKGNFIAQICAPDLSISLKLQYLIVDNFVVTFTDHGS